MCWLLRCLRRTILPTVLLCAFITFCPNIPPNATYKSFGNTLKPPAKFPSDTTLNAAERILQGQLVGAEAFAVYKGSLYTGLHGGHVVRVLSNNVDTVLKTGKQCEGIHQEHLCGRPLGLRIRNNFLYIADAYYGLFSHELSGEPGNLKLLLGPNIEVNSQPAKVFNSVEVDPDGTIYFTSSSSEFDINEGVHALLASGTGRLLKWDPKTKKVTELLTNLHFPNGIALTQDGQSILLAETTGRRILKYNIKSGNVQTLIEGLPGLPDNIQYAGENTFWVSLVSSSDEEIPAITDVLADWPNIRRFLGRALYLLELPFNLINQYYPNIICEKAAYHIGHLGPLFPILLEKVTIVRFDANNGNILDVLHGNNGIVKAISDVAVVGDYLYLGSPANNFIGRLPLLGNLKGKYLQTEDASKLKLKSDDTAAEAAQTKKAAEEAQAKHAAEEAAKKSAEEAKAKRIAEEAAKKAAEEAIARKKAAAEEAARKAAEEAKAKEEAAKKAAEEAARKAAEEAAKKAAEEAAKKAAEEAAKKAAEEAAKKAAEEAKAKKAAEEAQMKKAAEANKAADEAKVRKAAEEAKRAAEEAKARKVAESVGRAAKAAKEEDIKTSKIGGGAGKSEVREEL